jgi:hypothetical protein
VRPVPLELLRLPLDRVHCHILPSARVIREDEREPTNVTAPAGDEQKCSTSCPFESLSLPLVSEK